MSRHSLRALATLSVSFERPTLLPVARTIQNLSNESPMASSAPYSFQDSVSNFAMTYPSISQASRGTSNNHLQTPTPPNFKIPPVILLLTFIPIPPLLSVLYLTVGHAILRQAYQSSSSSIYHAPVLSSAEAAATGGLIVSLPITFLLYLAIFYYRQRSRPEDFFDDDSVLGSANWMAYIEYLACLLLFVGIGGIAGPLGVSCLSVGAVHALIVTKRMLSTEAAAAAGVVGGAVLSAAIVLFGTLTALTWSFWTTRKQQAPSPALQMTNPGFL